MRGLITVSHSRATEVINNKAASQMAISSSRDTLHQPPLYRRLLFKIFKSHWAPAIVALTGAVAGLWASIHSNELIAAVLSLRHLQFDAVAGEAWTAIVLFLAFFLFYAGQQSANNRQTFEAKTELFAETNKLAALIGRLDSLPPDGFLQKFQELHRLSADLWRIPAVGEESKETIELYIRNVLSSIAGLAHKFLKTSDGQDYSANLMLCRNQDQIQQLSKKENEDLEHRLLFCPDLPAPKLLHVTTVLDLIPQLCSDYEQGERHLSSTPSIALPVFHAKDTDLGPESGHKFKVLPGAPFAAITHAYAAFESAESLLVWCQDQADFTAATISEIRAYFGSGPGKQIKSFISIPVCVRTNEPKLASLPFGGLSIKVGDDQHEHCLGVLNIHSPAQNILGGDGYPLYVPIIEPFVAILAHLLEVYGNKLSSESTMDAKLSS